jgi:hypothetical protein
MSQVALSGNASGTGTFTIASPNSNTDRTLSLPDATGTVQVSGNPISGTTGTFSGAVSGTTGTFSGNVTLGSSVLATPTGSAPSYTCRAWVNFNGTGTVAIRASGNVTSVTDNGTGIYRINFTTAMPDANYSISSGIGDSTADCVITIATPTTAKFDFNSYRIPTGALIDAPYIAAAVFR